MIRSFISILFIACLLSCQSNDIYTKLDKRIDYFLNDFEDDEKECDKDACLSKELKQQIFDYEKRKGNFPGTTHFDEIYTFNPKNWNVGCLVVGDKASNLIESIIELDNHVAFIQQTSGFANVKSMRVYVRDENRIKSHWEVRRSSDSFKEIMDELMDEKYEVY